MGITISGWVHIITVFSYLTNNKLSMKKNSILILIILFALTLSAAGQLAIGYNTDGNTISLSTDPLNKLWGEFRVNTKSYNQAGWSYSDQGITQAYLITSVFSATNAILYAGGGLGINLFSENDKWLSINIPLGIRFNPFTKLPDLFISGEYCPMIVTSESIPIIHCVSLGLRYRLIRGD